VSERIADVIERAAGMAGETGGAEPRRAGRLLEIGVGTGRISLPLHRRGRRMVGIDLSAIRF